ncbi:PspC domain-containing protein [Paenibacillus bouchesdurhonensis]|uniref:PspC domain-containing protein n=1 Tax=Paenibacillus bouchesdurhonensis TaxID=1870990 RepID=UPI000DA5F983|nr:PspC domain-containing protein [Paenibacillus bouchesdurhonensis]
MGTLYRSRRDRWFSGLIGGLGEYFGISVTGLRLLMIFSVFITGGTTILIYLIASLVISKEPYIPRDPYGGGWQNGHGGHGGHGYGNPGGHGGHGYGNPGNHQHREPQYADPRYNDPHYQQQQQSAFGGNASNLDSMMEDIEKKAMEKELEELRRKLSKYENEKGDK